LKVLGVHNPQQHEEIPAVAAGTTTIDMRIPFEISTRV
jgi:hypothetical protein